MELHPSGGHHFIAVTAHTQDRYLGARVRGSQMKISILAISKMFEANRPSIIRRQYLEGKLFEGFQYLDRRMEKYFQYLNMTKIIIT